MTTRESRPGVQTQAAPEASTSATTSIIPCGCCCCTCHADAFRRTARRPRRRRLTEDRRRELANLMVRHGMGVETAAHLFRLTPKGVV